jgi:hypothetical protein
LLKIENGSGLSGGDVQFVDSNNPGGSGWGGAVGLPGLGYLLDNPTL